MLGVSAIRIGRYNTGPGWGEWEARPPRRAHPQTQPQDKCGQPPKELAASCFCLLAALPPKLYRFPCSVLGFAPAFLAARFAAIACISLPMLDWLMPTCSARLIRLPVPQ